MSRVKSSNKANKKSIFKTFKENKELLFLTIPGTLWFLVFAYLPMFGIVLAFKNWRIHGGFLESLIKSEWVGLRNFKFLFGSSDAWLITKNTILYNITFIILGIVIPVTLAILLKELLNKKLSKFYQSAMFLPYFLSWVVVSYCLYTFLSPDKGYLNNIITSLGGDRISWYTEPKYWIFIIIFMSQWKGVGYGTVVYLASICGIDKSYFEAAMIDGANKFQQIKYITLPLLKPVLIIMFITAVGGIFRADFGLFYQLPKDSGALYSVTNVIDTYVYRGLINLGDIGMSSAAALYQSFVGLVLILVTNGIVRKVDEENAFF
ncbi:ABC transporter [Candidatus Arthromitus sp. SFB-mouse-Japan]|uniref:ABC transporter permease n=1 Tax=unclassified Candidatus Neoarthromitus TaxID=2638829 RepID=UPI00021B7CED|nr:MULTISPECIES: ABC transporter permease subunit [unclassified Candidatus Arthromitus]EIA24339.1 ABC transporter, permease protein [Candidatus Arthromitus sp. SFB-1]EIA25695.1 ABC transporter, permease protein [Candidatus Arthromitus sp. SFB-4]EIA27454.1 ABC transporter, permease protein [Candidatus Arthromitus sp. SFB-co]EIA30832.1 ABC transporter, permease protein [Candidatus Arthromitus sp. SFB-mouse-SU]AID44777.1 Sugar ABC transporter, membrane-spanning permease protein [Candidatus Arthro